MAAERITCKNPRQKERKHNNGTRFDNCRGCPLLYTHKAENWRNDIVRCDSPVPIKFNDTVEIVPQTAKLIDDNKRRLKKIFFISADHIPHALSDACMDVDCEFPLHCSVGIVRINQEEHADNEFVQWLLANTDFEFDPEEDFGTMLGVWGT